MIIYKQPTPLLITKEQTKYVASINIDTRMPIDEMVEFFGLNLRLTDKDVGGYYGVNDKIIAINQDCFESEHIYTVLAHELSHHIQNETVDSTRNSLLNMIKYEQQAESISKFIIMPKLFPGEKQSYYSYFDEEDWNWLEKYCINNKYEVENDIEEKYYVFKRRFY